jgi:formylglycine-generating enzyme required for sulfatase activity/protocatechuate 3,4-dioxygenase beta subunit
MLYSRYLRNMAIIVVMAMLVAGNVWATENKQDELTMEFVLIPTGNFKMDSPSSQKDRKDNERPVHQAQITKSFYMSKHEVTQAQWEAVMGTTVKQQRDKFYSVFNFPWRLKGEGPDYPMYYVEWEEAVEFCKRIGDDFRLPTKAEWQYACWAGPQKRFYYRSDPIIAHFGQYAWYYGNSNNTTHPIGQKKPNEFGLYDMYGNVWELCFDKNRLKDSYKNAENVDSKEPISDNVAHVMYGGSWLENAEGCRSGSRHYGPGEWGDEVGFRVVFTGQKDGDKKTLKITLPVKAPDLLVDRGQQDETRPIKGTIITGVVRDQAGMPIDGAEIQILPYEYWLIRKYAKGEFEAFLPLDGPRETKPKYSLIARNIQQNLTAVVEIGEDANTFDIRLKPGVILTGKVVDSDGKGIEGARVIVHKLQASDWAELYLKWLETDAEGRFEFRALPPGYEYVLSAKKMHYLVGQTEVRSESVCDNHIDGISIVLPRGKFSVSGSVVDAKGKPVPNAMVYCTGKGQAGINSHTDADGRFKADGIFEGQVEVIANIKGDNGQWLSGSISTKAGATNVRIVLGTGGAPPPKGRACFPAGTDVWVNGMLLPIDKVKQGQTGRKAGCLTSTAHFGQIEKIEVHDGKFECRDILLVSGNRISVVEKHCFMLDSGKWIAAQNLRSGLRLKTLNGTVVIKNVMNRQAPFVGKVYNLKVKDSNQYIVGKDGVIVRDY